MTQYRVNAGGMLGALSVTGMLVCAGAAAQQSGAKAEVSGALEEIVVTAQRRSESQSKVPVSVTALNTDALQKQAVITESDLPASVPGLVVRATTNSNQLNSGLSQR